MLISVLHICKKDIQHYLYPEKEEYNAGKKHKKVGFHQCENQAGSRIAADISLEYCRDPAGPKASAAVYKQGSQGQAVRDIQRVLQRTGHYSGAIDGIYGPKTTAAVKSFQRSVGITVDGICGPVTLKYLGPSTTRQAEVPALHTTTTITFLHVLYPRKHEASLIKARSQSALSS